MQYLIDAGSFEVRNGFPVIHSGRQTSERAIGNYGYGDLFRDSVQYIQDLFKSRGKPVVEDKTQPKGEFGSLDLKSGLLDIGRAKWNGEIEALTGLSPAAISRMSTMEIADLLPKDPISYNGIQAKLIVPARYYSTGQLHGTLIVIHTKTGTDQPGYEHRAGLTAFINPSMPFKAAQFIGKEHEVYFPFRPDAPTQSSPTDEVYMVLGGERGNLGRRLTAIYPDPSYFCLKITRAQGQAPETGNKESRLMAKAETAFKAVAEAVYEAVYSQERLRSMIAKADSILNSDDPEKMIHYAKRMLTATREFEESKRVAEEFVESLERTAAREEQVKCRLELLV